MKVDVVAMPELTIQEIQQSIQQVENSPQKTKEPIDNNVPDDTDFLKEKEKKQKSFLNLLKDLGKKEVKQAKKVENNSNNIPTEKYRKDLKNIIMKGNKLNQGGLTSARESAAEISALGVYSLSVKDLVRTNWNLPRYLKEQDLQCRIKIFISKSGRLLNMILVESSGNTDYDQRALKAIKDAGEFPIPEESIQKYASEGKIILGFPL